MSQRPGLASSTTRVLLAEGLIVPSGLATAAYLGRALGPELYGLFSVATAVSVTLEWAIVSLFGRTTVKLLGETENWRPVASTILTVHLVVGLAIAAAFWAGADWVAHLLGDARLAPWLALLALEVPIATTAAACRNIMTGRGNFRGRALATAVRWVLRPVAIAVFVEAGWSVTGAVVGSLTAAIGGLIVAMTMARVPVFTTTRAPIANLWRLAVPMFILSISLRLIDKLGLFAVQTLGSSPLEAGWYAAAQNFAIPPGLVALSFSPLLLAELTRVRTQGTPEAARALVAQALRAVVALLPCVAIGAGSAHEIVRVVYGTGFDAAAHLSWPLLLAAFAMLLVSVTTAVLIAADRASTAAVCVWPLVPVAALALALVVPHAGGYGAAVVTAVAVSVSAGACLTMVGLTEGVVAPGWHRHQKHGHRAHRGRGGGLVVDTRYLGGRQTGRARRADAAGLCGRGRVRPTVAAERLGRDGWRRRSGLGDVLGSCGRGLAQPGGLGRLACALRRGESGGVRTMVATRVGRPRAENGPV